MTLTTITTTKDNQELIQDTINSSTMSIISNTMVSSHQHLDSQIQRDNHQLMASNSTTKNTTTNTIRITTTVNTHQELETNQLNIINSSMLNRIRLILEQTDRQTEQESMHPMEELKTKQASESLLLNSRYLIVFNNLKLIIVSIKVSNYVNLYLHLIKLTCVFYCRFLFLLL